jgi:hypothetical protein
VDEAVQVITLATVTIAAAPVVRPLAQIDEKCSRKKAQKRKEVFLHARAFEVISSTKRAWSFAPLALSCR